MRNTLIIQFKSDDFPETWDFLIGIEDSLIQLFNQNDYGIVDGHDIGQGQMNIFLYPRGSWGPVIDRVEAILKHKGCLNKAIIAKRIGKSGNYHVVFPKNFNGKFEIT
jgi:hypothetical protein